MKYSQAELVHSHCAVLQCVEAYCSVAMRCTPTSMQCSERAQTKCVAVRCSVLQCVAVCCIVLQCITVCCSVLQCVAVCCSVLQYVAV